MSHQSDKMKASITSYGFQEKEKKKTNKKSANNNNASN